MIKSRIRPGLLAAFLLISMAKFASADTYSYSVDPAHSKIGFDVTHLVISTVEGKFQEFEGTFEFDDKNLKSSKLTAVVDVNSIDTGVAKRDKHLRSKDFFEVEKFPKMTFKSTSVAGDLSAIKLIGDLTIKGITKKIQFDAKYLGQAKDPYGNLKVAFYAETKISRKEFGLLWNNMVEAGPVVGDEVKIVLRIEAGRPLTAEELATK